jgi:hypothetical protein
MSPARALEIAGFSRWSDESRQHRHPVPPSPHGVVFAASLENVGSGFVIRLFAIFCGTIVTFPAEETMNKRILFVVCVALIGSTAAAHEDRSRRATPPCGPAVDVKNVAADSRCFELRTYTVREGSSIDLLHSRFRDHTNALFRKHGMTIIGFWQPVARRDQLIYILAYKDAAARDSSWAAFNADPDWVKTRTDMQVNVQVDNAFMVATDYSPIK